MKWSKLKQKIEESFADSIKNQIKLYNTVYRKSYDSSMMSRSWVEIQGKEIASFCDYTSESIYNVLYHENTPVINCATHKQIEKEARSPENLCEKGEFSSLDFKKVAFIYVNTSAQNSIKSNHPLLRALGTLNKKTGKNKLKKLLEDEHPLVSYLANYRLNEEINLKSKD